MATTPTTSKRAYGLTCARAGVLTAWLAVLLAMLLAVSAAGVYPLAVVGLVALVAGPLALAFLVAATIGSGPKPTAAPAAPPPAVSEGEEVGQLDEPAAAPVRDEGPDTEEFPAIPATDLPAAHDPVLEPEPEPEPELARASEPEPAVATPGPGAPETAPPAFEPDPGREGI